MYEYSDARRPRQYLAGGNLNIVAAFPRGVVHSGLEHIGAFADEGPANWGRQTVLTTRGLPSTSPVPQWALVCNGFLMSVSACVKNKWLDHLVRDPASGHQNADRGRRWKQVRILPPHQFSTGGTMRKHVLL